MFEICISFLWANFQSAYQAFTTKNITKINIITQGRPSATEILVRSSAILWSTIPSHRPWSTKNRLMTHNLWATVENAEFFLEWTLMKNVVSKLCLGTTFLMIQNEGDALDWVKVTLFRRLSETITSKKWWSCSFYYLYIFVQQSV